MLRLTPLSMFQVFRIALPSLCIPSTSVASQCHFPQSSRPVGPDLAIKRHAPTTGGGPAPLQIGERGNRFLRMARDQRAPPDRHAAQPVTARFMRTCRRNVSTRRQAQNQRSPSAPRKSIPPRNAGALIGWLQQQSGVQTQFWSVPFIGDSLLQVNRNCLGRASNAVEHSLGKGEVVSFNPYRQPHFYWLSSTSSLTQLCNSVRNDPGTCGSGRRGNFDSLPLRSPSLHAAVALGVDFRKLRAKQKYLR